MKAKGTIWRMLVLSVTTLALLISAPSTRASTFSRDVGNNPKHDFAVGGGQHGFDDVNEGFAAHSGPAGEDPQGYISATLLMPDTQRLRGEVICLHVVGNEAFILAVQTEVGGNIPQGEHFLLHVVDNGNPIRGMSPDLIRNSFSGGFVPPEEAAQLGYPCGQPLVSPVPLERGNIIVHDAHP